MGSGTVMTPCTPATCAGWAATSAARSARQDGPTPDVVVQERHPLGGLPPRASRRCGPPRAHAPPASAPWSARPAAAGSGPAAGPACQGGHRPARPAVATARPPQPAHPGSPAGTAGPASGSPPRTGDSPRPAAACLPDAARADAALPGAIRAAGGPTGPAAQTEGLGRVQFGPGSRRDRHDPVTSRTAGHASSSPPGTAAPSCATRWPASPPAGTAAVVVVDNGSTDGTPAMVRRHFPGTELIALRRNRGAWARNLGVLRARTPLIALAMTTPGGRRARWPPRPGAGSQPAGRAARGAHPGRPGPGPRRRQRGDGGQPAAVRTACPARGSSASWAAGR